jgi:hypothetical protein
LPSKYLKSIYLLAREQIRSRQPPLFSTIYPLTQKKKKGLPHPAVLFIQDWTSGSITLIKGQKIAAYWILLPLKEKKYIDFQSYNSTSYTFCQEKYAWSFPKIF